MRYAQVEPPPEHFVHERMKPQMHASLPRPPLSTDEGDGRVERSQLFFDAGLVCDHPAIGALLAHAVNEGEKMLAAKGVRTRRAQYRKSFSALAHALVANAAYALALRDPERTTVAIPLAKPKAARSRYDGPGLGQLASVLDAISPDLVTVRKSRHKGIASALKPGDGLRDCIAGLDDFGP